MKVLLVLSALVGLALSYEQILVDYHEKAGIPMYNKIKAMEEAMDFDGARITGGSTGNAGDEPHLVGIVVRLSDGRQSVCGASMLSNTRSVTAAHCWRNPSAVASSFTLVFGSAFLLSGGVRVEADDVQMHENYNEYSLANDIAMIVHSHVAYFVGINRILIPSGDNEYIGYWAVAAGFGRTNDGNGNASNPRKHHVVLRILSNDVCRSHYGDQIVSSSNLCVFTSMGHSTCAGDSGGPLAIGNGLDRELIGISSYLHASGCNQGFPAGFTRVTSFRSWIQARM